GDGKNRRWRDCLSFPRRPTRTRGHAAALATRLRIDRAPRRGAGCPYVVGPALGFDLLVPGRKIFQKTAEAHSLPGDDRVRQTASGHGCRYSNSPRTAAQTWRILLQPPPIVRSTSCRRMLARAEATPVCN